MNTGTSIDDAEVVVVGRVSDSVLQEDLLRGIPRQSDTESRVTAAGLTRPTQWPNALPEQVAAVARVLATSPIPLSETDLAARFTGKGPWKKRLPKIIDTLEALGRVRRQGDVVTAAS